MKINEIEFVKGVVSPAGYPRDGLPEIAFLGRSNVGKSSLLNLVTGRRSIARTSRTPGKTREINYFLINGKAYLVDLPGYGYAKVSRTQREAWAKLMAPYLQQRPTVKLIFHLIDSRHPPTDLDRVAIGLCAGSQARYVMVLTKTDKPNQRERAASTKALAAALTELGIDPPIVQTSAAAHRGADALLAHIAAAITGGPPPTSARPAARKMVDVSVPAPDLHDAPPTNTYSGTSTTEPAAIQPPPPAPPPSSASRSQRPRRST